MRNTPYQTPVPAHLRDTHYHGAKSLGNGKAYKYPHDYERHYIPQQYLPDELKDRVYYQPSDEGYEKKIRETRRYMRKNKEKDKT